MFSPSLGLCFYWPSGVPRGQAVTRFPGTRQEEEKQNKPERAVTACGLHWKGGLIISIRGTYTRSDTKQDVCASVLKVSRTGIYSFLGNFAVQWIGVSPRWRISFEANGRSVVVVYRASAGMRKGADGGHTDYELRVQRKRDSSVPC